MAKAKAQKLLPVHVTRLEMRHMPAHREHPPSGFRLALMRLSAIPASYYRYLYREVGKPHHWALRREAADEELAALLAPQKAEIFVLYVEGCPAGFFELNLLEKPEIIHIQYFGLTPHYLGRGLGKYFISEAIFAAWAHNPKRVGIETNTLDSPRAIALYQRAGFEPVASFDEKIPAWL
jgi:GNAT superfamily N-acetyltransferase